jgi:type I restriction enzyme R subunit
MVSKNKQRMWFVNKLNNILSEYNQWSKNIDDIFSELLELAYEINEEDKRVLRENLSEEELAIFDLLKKEDLKPDEEKEVKKASSELLKSLKDKLVLDWRKYEPKRADVEVAIEDYLYYNLPRSYDLWLVKIKSHQVYMHIFESYAENWKSVYEIVNF